MLNTCKPWEFFQTSRASLHARFCRSTHDVEQKSLRKLLKARKWCNWDLSVRDNLLKRNPDLAHLLRKHSCLLSYPLSDQLTAPVGFLKITGMVMGGNGASPTLGLYLTFTCLSWRGRYALDSETGQLLFSQARLVLFLQWLGEFLLALRHMKFLLHSDYLQFHQIFISAHPETFSLCHIKILI